MPPELPKNSPVERAMHSKPLAEVFTPVIFMRQTLILASVQSDHQLILRFDESTSAFETDADAVKFVKLPPV